LSNAPQTEASSSTYFIERLPMYRAYEETLIVEDETGQRTASPSAEAEQVAVNLIDINRWIENVFNGTVPEENDDAIYFEDNIGTRKMSNLEKALYLIIFSGKLKSFIKKHNRNFVDISDGQKCHSETICYKVLKYAGGSDPIQTIWLPNTNEIDVIKYVDTQVKFDKEYTYEVFACQMIIGTEYEYVKYTMPVSYLGVDFGDPPPFDGEEVTDRDIFKTDYGNRLFVAAEERQAVNTDVNYKANIYLQSTPSVKIAEVPFFSSVGKVIDDPPVFPNVDMIPYRGVKNKILINLSPTVGEYELQPVVFNNNEQLIVDDIRNTKDLFSDEPITFTTDDYVSRYEIYRMETPPEKIEDFSQNLRNVLTVSASNRGVSSASFVDDIEPNKEYYYTFRTIDIHGKVSNPSAIYRLIMVENSGAVYPLLEVYEIGQEKPKEISKSLKKLLNIKPRLSQTIINQALSSLGNGASVKDVSNIVLGVEEKSLFGKRFKIRLTSKHTGKQIDLNVRFNVEVNKN
jgi:hypothetical protein